MTKEHKEATNTEKKYFPVVIISCAICLILLGIVVGLSLQKNTTRLISADQTIMHARQTLTNNTPEYSSVCVKYSLEKISSITGLSFNELIAAIKDTETSEGSVASCSYHTIHLGDNKQSSSLKSLNIMVRSLSTPEQARESFNKLTGGDQKTLVTKDGYILNQNQLILLRDRRVITASPSGASTATAHRVLSALSDSL